MKSTTALALALVLVLSCRTAATEGRAQGLSLLGQGASGAASVDAGEAVAVAAPSDGPYFGAAGVDAVEQSLLQKTSGLYGDQAVVTEAEFLAYLRMVEALNPGATWQQVVTKLHATVYSMDHSLRVGLRLFPDGAENEGWERVQLPPGAVPRRMVDARGDEVNLKHAYAGVAAAVNRSSLTRDFWTNVNTDLGDDFQVSTAEAWHSARWLFGAVTRDFDLQTRAAQGVLGASAYKSPDQARGNALGRAVNDRLRYYRTLDLSSAFEAVLASRQDL